MNTRLAMAAAAAFVLSAGTAGAQQPKAPAAPPKPAAAQQRPAAPAESVRYLTFVAMDGGNVLFDAVVKETRRQNRTVSAEADLCYSPSPTSRRYERATGPMKLAGEQLSGVLKETTGSGAPEFSYRLRGAGTDLKVEGALKRAGRTIPVSVEGASTMTPEEFTEAQADSTEIVTAFDYAKVSGGGRIVALVRPDAVSAALGALAPYPVRIDAYGLLQSCEQLRRGAHRLQIALDPAVAAEALAKLRTTPGVARAGWEAGAPTESSIRVAFGPDAQTGGKVDPAKAAAVIAPIVAAALGAKQVGGVVRDGGAGGYKLSFEKASDAVPGLALTEAVEAGVQILADPAAPGQSFVEFSGVSYRLKPAAGTRLEEINLNGAEDYAPGGSLNESDIAKAAAIALKGQIWDSASEPGRWIEAK